MDIRLVDHWRNVTMFPMKATTYRAALDGLLKDKDIESGQLEFECDVEFYAALAEESGDVEGPGPFLSKPDKPWREGHEATYCGVPIIVVSG